MFFTILISKHNIIWTTKKRKSETKTTASTRKRFQVQVFANLTKVSSEFQESNKRMTRLKTEKEEAKREVEYTKLHLEVKSSKCQKNEE